MTDTATFEDFPGWSYDADPHDPLTALRIPATDAFPSFRYIAAFDRHSEARPTDLEARQLASFIEQYKVYFFGENSSWKRKLEQEPFDCDAVTTVFHKWAQGDWSYRITTWQRGPFWVPVQPGLRGTEYDYEPCRGPLDLARLLDRKHGLEHGDDPTSAWTRWKAAHPDVFDTAREASP